MFPAGDVVAGRYRIVRFIAQGGMGEVYEAEDLELRERVALKTIRSDIADDERVARSASSARSSSRARSRIRTSAASSTSSATSLAGRGDAGTPTVLFLTMELLPGETLAERLRREGPIRRRPRRCPIVAADGRGARRPRTAPASSTATSRAPTSCW